MRKMLLRLAVGGALVCAGTSLATHLLQDDPPVPAIAGDTNPVTGGPYCGANCPKVGGGEVWCTIGFCGSGKTCCGHVFCNEGGCTGSLECCAPNETCNNGLGSNPPTYPKCTSPS